MSKFDLKNSLTKTFGKIGFQMKKHSPEILLTIGVAGVVGGAVAACFATTKVSSIMDEKKKSVADIHKCLEDPELKDEYTEEDSKKDLAIVYAQTGLKLAKTYAPAVILEIASIGCILASYGIIRKRNVAVSMAYTAVASSFKKYRERVIDRFGEDLDRELRYNVKTKEVEETVVDEKGEEKKVKKTVKVVDENDINYLDKFYDDGCKGWSKSPEQNLFFLVQQQNYANEKLKSQGHLFLNDVYEMLGIPKTAAGQVAGWIYAPDNPNHNGDNYVDFGIYDVSKPKNMDFVNGYERSILLSFNVDGDILYYFNKK